MSNTETKNFISKIKIPGNDTTYVIRDDEAIHEIADLGLSAALVFKGTKTEYSDLPTTENKVGDVWLITNTNTEYVWTSSFKWEPFGDVHDAASSTHKHDVTVAGQNESSAVTGSVTIPTVSTTTKYMTAEATAPGIDLTTTSITATADGTELKTESTSVITGFDNQTTAGALGSNTTFKVTGGAVSTEKMVTNTINNPSVTDANVPTVAIENDTVVATSVTSFGSQAVWGATVDDYGVLSFTWQPNTIGSGDPVTASKVKAGEVIYASKVTTEEVTVATGQISTDGTGSEVVVDVGAVEVSANSNNFIDVITSLGTANTTDVLTSVEVKSEPTINIGNGGSVVTGVTIDAPTVTLKANTTDKDSGGKDIPCVEYSVVSVGSTTADVTGTAEAQTWKSTSISVSEPADNTSK